MTFFPNILFQIDSHSDHEVLKAKLDHLLKSEKYEGYWENNILYISRIYQSKNRFPTDFYIEILNQKTDRTISVRSALRYSAELVFKLVALAVIFAEVFLITIAIRDHSFHYSVFVPLVIGGLYYLLIKNDLIQAVRNFKNDLLRALK